MSAETIKFLALILVELVGTYIFAWFGLYALFLEGDFSHFFDYFVMSWSGRGELPALIQSYALLISGAGTLLGNMGRLLRKYYL
jgi:hypothetical protein